jgi:hypothetical protein
MASQMYLGYQIVPKSRIHEGRNPRPHPTLKDCYIVEVPLTLYEWVMAYGGNPTMKMKRYHERGQSDATCTVNH